jgi:hypothetical protein
MGIQVELWVANERVRRLPDPVGGFFDAAGDFHRLMFLASPALRLLGEVDPHGETCFGAGQMQRLIAEVELLLNRTTAGAEHRGLMRLHAMACTAPRSTANLCLSATEHSNCASKRPLNARLAAGRTADLPPCERGDGTLAGKRPPRL